MKPSKSSKEDIYYIETLMQIIMQQKLESQTEVFWLKYNSDDEDAEDFQD